MRLRGLLVLNRPADSCSDNFLDVEPRMDMTKVSVVIASHNAGPIVADCLAALQGQPAGRTAEIIVADSSTDGIADLIQERFPEVRLLHFSEPLTIPQLRGAAIAKARGEIIAILDPYCIVDDGWFAELIKVHTERPELAIGGAVELDRMSEQSLVNWATYFCEYSGFMLPLKAGPAAELTGNNVTYKRRALEANGTLRRVGFWKTFTNRQQADGNQLWTAPSLIVRLRKPIRFGGFFRSRYHHGRCFAAMRVARAPRYEQWLRTFTVPLLPWLTLWRQARSVWPKRRHRAKFLMAVPLLLLFNSSWALGELCGYLRGAGGSCAELFY